MKKIKKPIVIVLAVIMLFSALVIPASAAYQTLPLGKAIALKPQYTYNSKGANIRNNTFYVLKLTADSVLTVKWVKNVSNRANITLYCDAARTKTVKYVSTYDKVAGTQYYSLAKGVYYIDMYDGYSNYDYTPTTVVACSVKNQSLINKTNYCRARAIGLAANTWVCCAQTPNYSYVRWYKIKTTAKQVINIYTNAGMGYSVSLYDARLNRVSSTIGSQQLTTQGKVAAGYYYIIVREPTYFGSYDMLGEFIQLKWR